MPILLHLLFVVVVFSPEPLTNPPLQYWQNLQTLNASFDGTNAEGWDKAMFPESTMVTLAVDPSAVHIYRGMGNGASDVEEWRPLVAGQFPPEQLENALCAIKAESGGNPNAKNPNSNARGLAQIMTSIWGPYFGFTNEDFYVPELNIYAMARIWEMSGWTPWSPRTRRLCGL